MPGAALPRIFILNSTMESVVDIGVPGFSLIPFPGDAGGVTVTGPTRLAARGIPTANKKVVPARTETVGDGKVIAN